jgi:hypothetical protein
MELQGNNFKYELLMNVNGLAANIQLKAYNIEQGERVYYPENNVQILTNDARLGDTDMLQAAVTINQAIQTYITAKEL